VKALILMLYTGSYIKSQNGYDAEEKDDDIFGANGGDEPAVLLLMTRPNSAGLLAFSSFRFVQDDTMDDEKMVDVCYWFVSYMPDLVKVCRADASSSYEVQVSSVSRGLGLGKFLMRCLETFARAYKVEQVTLTVFECKQCSIWLL
jgi:hypothetical protein